MKHVRIPQKQTDTDYIKFYGGLDLVTPVLSIKAGNALDAVNYEPGRKGGYQRIDGYERFDGRPSPSAATYTYLEANITGMILAGYVVTGATSGATGTVIVIGQNDMALTKVTGTFVNGEALNYGGGPVATLTMPPLQRGYRTAYDDAVALAAAADLYRADIQAVPGSGSVRGAWMYKGVLYAFRDNAGATACVMHKSTATGWQAVNLNCEISFTGGNDSVNEGDVLTQGGVTATILRVMQTTTAVSPNRVGRLIITAPAGGNFAAGAATSTGGGALTLSGAQTAITLQPGGRYEFVNYNFTGSSATFRMYGCDGVNRAFEFDGTVFAPIATGMSQDNPKFIAVHKKKLWLAYMGSLQNSGDGLPYQWTVVTGANEMGIGDDIVGMAVQPGDTLAVFSRNSAWQVNGTTTSSFQLLPISPTTGAIPYTVQSLGRTYAMDDRGIIETIRVQNYGNFDYSTVSEEIQPIIDALRSKVIGATTYPDRGQYRLYASDGSGVVMTVSGEKIVGFTQFLYPVGVSCVSSCEDATGKSMVFFGSTNGYVYQADKGSSFDGAEIEAYLRMPFSSLQSPRHRKQYKKATLEMTAVAYSAIRFQPEFSYGDPDVATHRLQTGEVTGSGGLWDVSNWESFFFDARLVSSPEFGIEGRGLNMALLFYSKSKIDLGHTLQGMLVDNSLGRRAR